MAAFDAFGYVQAEVANMRAGAGFNNYRADRLLVREDRSPVNTPRMNLRIVRDILRDVGDNSPAMVNAVVEFADIGDDSPRMASPVRVLFGEDVEEPRTPVIEDRCSAVKRKRVVEIDLTCDETL